jgi:lactose/L-arabinose transport system substrate-binding protein
MDGDENYTNYSSCEGHCWVVLNKDNKKVAIDFLMKTVAVSDSIADKMAKEHTVVPALKSGKDTASAKAGDPYFGNQNVVEIMAEWSLHVPYVNYGLHPYEIINYHGSLLPDYIRGQTSVDNVIKALQQQAEIIESR